MKRIHRHLLARVTRLQLVSAALLLSAGVVGCDKPTASTDPAPKASAKPPAEAKALPLAHHVAVDELTLPVMPKQPQPKDGPASPEKVALGKRLFFDKRLSVDGSLACYSCHQDEQGGGGKDPLAIGAGNRPLPRHSPVIWNVGHLSSFYWDGRADTLEAQALGAWAGGNMGVGKENLDKKARDIAALPEYKADFERVFPGEKVSAAVVAAAISAFERTLECKATAYDKYAAGDKSALLPEQKAGLEIFLGKGMCAACHAPPFFSAAYAAKGAFFNVGVGTQGIPEDQVDVGRMKVTGDEKDWAAFKVPTLRNVTRTAPYFHDGSAASLKEAVVFMASGGHDNKNKNPLMSDKQLTDAEIESILSFLKALECEGTVEAAPAQSAAPVAATPQAAPAPPATAR